MDKILVTLPGLDETLTAAEIKIARLLLKGYSRKSIASERCISISCVNFHIKNIFTKTGCESINLFLIKYGNAFTE